MMVRVRSNFASCLPEFLNRIAFQTNGRKHLCLFAVLLFAMPVLAQSGNVVATTVQATGSTAPNTNGGYLLWNSSGGAGETDFINNNGGGWQGGFQFFDAPPSGSPLFPVMTITGAGYVGLQTFAPQNILSVYGGINVDGNDDNNGNPFYNDSIYGISFGYSSGEGIASNRVNVTGAQNLYGLDFFTSFSNRFSITNGGNVGVATTAPGADLSSIAAPPPSGTAIFDVNGWIELAQGSQGKIVFSDGTEQATAFDPSKCGADYAESVGVTGDRTKYEPGDVLVLDPKEPGKFLKSNQPYSTMVSGIYSTKPGFVGRLHPPDAALDAAEVPMAMVGRVPTKVSTENGPIKVGDLLVTSSTMGYAMKGTDRSQMLGSVVGKAMGSLDSGTGVIMVLVTLQ